MFGNKDIVERFAPHASLAADHLASAAGGFEPQRKFQYFMYLNGVPGAENIRLAMLASFLPTEENEVITLQYGNEEVHVAGRLKYSEGSITVRDMVDKDIYRLLRDWRRQVDDVVSGNIGFAAAYKKTARIVLVAPDNTVARQVQLTGLWPTKIEGGSLSYAENDVVLITMTLRYDKALPTA